MEFDNYSATISVGYGEDLSGGSTGATDSIEIFFPETNIFGEGVEVSSVAVDYDENPFYLNEVTTDENGDVTTETLGEAIQLQLQLDGETFEPIVLEEPMLILFENVITELEEQSNRRLLSAEFRGVLFTCVRYDTDTGGYTSDDMITGEYSEENDTLECYVTKLFPFSLFSLAIANTESALTDLTENPLEYKVTTFSNELKDLNNFFSFVVLYYTYPSSDFAIHYLQLRGT